MANIGNLIEMLRGYSLSRTIMDLFNAESYFFSIALQSQLDLSLPRLGKEGKEKKKTLIVDTLQCHSLTANHLDEGYDSQCVRIVTNVDKSQIIVIVAFIGIAVRELHSYTL